MSVVSPAPPVAAATAVAGATVAPATEARRDGFLDTVRAVALARVIVWHTWAWWWMSWLVAAMPAMFFVAGWLLDDSVERHGALETIRRRVRRLLPPLWVYAAVAIPVMVAGGWEPDLGGVLWWLFPLWDPMGSLDGAALWVPLWYLRAYLWLVLAGGALSALARRLGWRAVAVPVVGTVVLGAVTAATGWVPPLALSDVTLYGAFALAGMAARRSPPASSRPAVAAGLGAAALAVAVVVHRFAGSPDGSAQGALVVHLLVGAGWLALAWSVRGPLGSLRGRPQVVVRWIGSRALTLYLWHGMGLFVADRLVARHGPGGPLGSLASLLVVVGVAVGAAWLLGWVEDAAAGRPPRYPARPAAVPAAAVLVVAVVLAAPAPARGAGALPAVPPSGQAAAVRAALVAEALAAQDAGGPPAGDRRLRAADAGEIGVQELAGVVEQWVREHRSNLGYLRTQHIEVAVTRPGEPVLSVSWSPAPGRRAGTGHAGALLGVPPAPTPLDELAAAYRLAVSQQGDEAAGDEGASAGDDASEESGESEAVESAAPDGEAAGGLTSEAVLAAAPVGPGEVVHWWSISKSATAAWLLRLAEQDVVRLDDPLSRWLPELPFASSITLEQLARHTSGVPTQFETWSDHSDPRHEVDAFRSGGALLFPPGSGFSYSRTGYYVLAWALERASGTTWRAAMEEFAARAGVTLGFDEDLESLPDGHPSGTGATGRLWASGGLRGSVADGARFFAWVYGEGLDDASVETMTRFSTDPEHWLYGVGLVPVCPCERRGDELYAERFGHDSAAGSFVVDRVTGATSFLGTDSWFAGGQPDRSFYELQQRILDVVGDRPLRAG